MGLDMYLTKKHYVKNWDWEENPERKYDVDVKRGGKTIPHIKKERISYIEEEVMYWRKANQIHAWFVENVQDGVDECQEVYVSHDKLKELLTLCRQALFHKDPKELMPQGGFFFGGTDIDEWYWADIKDTIKQIAPLVEKDEYKGLSYYYQSSW